MQAPSFKNKDVQALFEAVQSRDPDQPEFLQAVEEVLQTMEPVFEKHPECALPTPTSLFSMILTSTFWHNTSCTIPRMLSFHCQLAGVDVVQGHTQPLRHPCTLVAVQSAIHSASKSCCSGHVNAARPADVRGCSRPEFQKARVASAVIPRCMSS